MNYMYFYHHETNTTKQNRAIRYACRNGDSVVPTRSYDASRGILCSTHTKTAPRSSLTLYFGSKPFPRDLVEDLDLKFADREKRSNKNAFEKPTRKYRDAGTDMTVQTGMSPPDRSQMRTKDGCIRRKRRSTFWCYSCALDLITPTRQTLSNIYKMVLFFPLSDIVSLSNVIALLYNETKAITSTGEADSEKEKETAIRESAKVGFLVGSVIIATNCKNDNPQPVDHVLKGIFAFIVRHNLPKNATTAEIFLGQFQAGGKRNKPPF